MQIRLDNRVYVHHQDEKVDITPDNAEMHDLYKILSVQPNVGENRPFMIMRAVLGNHDPEQYIHVLLVSQLDVLAWGSTFDEFMNALIEQVLDKAENNTHKVQELEAKGMQEDNEKIRHLLIGALIKGAAAMLLQVSGRVDLR